MTPGVRNQITDVPGLRIGSVHDERLRSGVTVVLGDRPLRGAVDIRGGGPGTRDTHALMPEGVASEVHGVVFSGGSAFGLDAATGAQAWLRERGEGFAVGPARVPIVPQAILFDLLNGGDKDWGRFPPYRDMAYAACESADENMALGSAGAGYGATTQRLKGGLGSASAVTEDGITLGALAAVNAAGNVTLGESRHFWAAPFEIGGEFGGHGWPQTMPADALEPRTKAAARADANTTLAVVATDADLDKLALKRLAIMAQTGLSRSIYPVHTPFDGDIVFALSTARGQAVEPIFALAELGALASCVLARAVARAVFEAAAFAGGDGPPAYRDIYPAN